MTFLAKLPFITYGQKEILFSKDNETIIVNNTAYLIVDSEVKDFGFLKNIQIWAQQNGTINLTVNVLILLNKVLLKDPCQVSNQ